jgi:DNA-binding transcriptional LysR family regulator
LDIALTLPPHKLPRELEMKELARYEACVVVGTTHPLAKLKFVNLNQMVSVPVKLQPLCGMPSGLRKTDAKEIQLRS